MGNFEAGQLICLYFNPLEIKHVLLLIGYFNKTFLLQEKFQYLNQ